MGKFYHYIIWTFVAGLSSCIPPSHPIPKDTRPLSSQHTNALEDGEALPYFIDYTEAMKRLGISDVMADPGPYTFFIPNANAFKVFLKTKNISSLDELPDEELSQILLNHIIRGAYMIIDIPTGYYASLAVEKTTQNPIDIYIIHGALFEMNNQLCLGTSDILTDNGIIQNLTKVLDLPTVLDHLIYNPEFSDLYHVLSRTDLDRDYYSVLSDPEPITFFAPADTAFTTLLNDHPDWHTLDDIPASFINSMLNYSIIRNNNILLKNITDDSTITAGVNNKIEIRVNKNYRGQVTGYQADLAQLLHPDIQATNGVIQQIDRILIP